MQCMLMATRNVYTHPPSAHSTKPLQPRPCNLTHTTPCIKHPSPTPRAPLPLHTSMYTQPQATFIMIAHALVITCVPHAAPYTFVAGTLPSLLPYSLSLSRFPSPPSSVSTAFTHTHTHDTAFSHTQATPLIRRPIGGQSQGRRAVREGAGGNGFVLDVPGLDDSFLRSG